MTVGSCLIEIRLDTLQTLKDKRTLRQSIIERLRNRFNASVAEVGRQDSIKDLAIGIAIVGPNPGSVQKTLEGMVRFVEDNFPCDSLDYSIEVS